MPAAVVTGAAGFIGSHLVDALLERGWDVRAVDDLSATGSWSNIEKDGERGARSALKSYRFSVTDEVPTDPQVIFRADVVFHLAAHRSVPRSVADPLGSNAANVTGTLHVLEAARRAGVRRVVFASSSSVYGDQPTAEKHEAMEPRPASPYALQKRVGEDYCRFYGELYGLETVALRYFNVYGPRQDPASEYAAVVPRFIRAALDGKPATIYGDGSQTRDFTFVGDVVEATILAAEVPEAAGHVLNVCTGRSTSVLELRDAMFGATGRALRADPVAARPGDVLHTRGSPALAKSILGFEAQTLLCDGLRETAATLAGGS